MKLKIDGNLMWGDYTESQIDRISLELQKPKDKRLYLMGIEFSMVESVEVKK